MREGREVRRKGGQEGCREGGLLPQAAGLVIRRGCLLAASPSRIFDIVSSASLTPWAGRARQKADTREAASDSVINGPSKRSGDLWLWLWRLWLWRPAADNAMTLSLACPGGTHRPMGVSSRARGGGSADGGPTSAPPSRERLTLTRCLVMSMVTSESGSRTVAQPSARARISPSTASVLGPPPPRHSGSVSIGFWSLGTCRTAARTRSSVSRRVRGTSSRYPQRTPLRGTTWCAHALGCRGSGSGSCQ